MKTFGMGLGIVFGFLLNGAGLTNYDLIHQGLLLADPTMFLVMGSAIVTALPGIWLLERLKWVTFLQGPITVKRIPFTSKHLYGALVFGTGWALTGTCPAVSAAMLGSGTLDGAAVIAGLLAGVLLFDLRKRGVTGRGDLPPLREMIGNGITTAVFDVDNTIAKCNIVKFYFFIEKNRRQGRKRNLFLLSLVFKAPYLIVLNLISRESFTRQFVRRNLECFSYEELDRYAEQFFREEISRRLIASTSDFIMELKAHGVRVVLLSTNYDLIVKRLAEFFDADYLCHKVIRSGDRAIFDCSELASFKQRHILAFPENSIGVGDSRYDIPVLNHVKYPFVVANKTKGWFNALHRSPWLLDPAVRKP